MLWLPTVIFVHWEKFGTSTTSTIALPISGTWKDLIILYQMPCPVQVCLRCLYQLHSAGKTSQRKKKDDEERIYHRSSSSSLLSKDLPLPAADGLFVFNISTAKPPTFVPSSERRLIYTHVSSPSLPGVSASIKLIPDRYIWLMRTRACLPE